MTDHIQSSKWLVNLKGSVQEKIYEISIVRENNNHGIISFGWFGKNKVLIACNNSELGNWDIIPILWDLQLKLAKDLAAKLNLEEFGTSEDVKVIRKSYINLFIK